MKIYKILIIIIISIIFISCISTKEPFHENYNYVNNKFENKDTTIAEIEIKHLLKQIKKNKNDSLFGIISTKAYFYFYEKDAKKCLYFLQETAENANEMDDKKKYANALQNMAFVYDEKLNNYKKALKYSKKSANISTKLKDSINLANSLKYIGLINGKLKRFSEGKKYISKAIRIYTDCKFEKGVAVSYNDLARVFKEEELNDSSIYYFTKSKNIWKKYSGYNRIFQINNYILELLIDAKQTSNYKESYQENLELLESERIRQEEIERFKSIVGDI